MRLYHIIPKYISTYLLDKTTNLFKSYVYYFGITMYVYVFITFIDMYRCIYIYQEIVELNSIV